MKQAEDKYIIDIVLKEPLLIFHMSLQVKRPDECVSN